MSVVSPFVLIVSEKGEPASESASRVENPLASVTHAPAGRGKGNHSTRVRLDMLGLKLASCALHCELTTRLATKHWGATVRNRCWKNRTQPGYLSPACFEKAPVCTLAKLHPEYDD